MALHLSPRPPNPESVAARTTGPDHIPPQQPPGAHRRPRAGGGGDRAQGTAGANRFLYSSRTQPTLDQTGTPQTRARAHTRLMSPHTTNSPASFHAHTTHVSSTQQHHPTNFRKINMFYPLFFQSPCTQILSHPGKNLRANRWGEARRHDIASEDVMFPGA